MTDYTLISRYRNKQQCELLIRQLEKRGKSCYNFGAAPADPDNPYASVEEQMSRVEANTDFFNDPHLQATFERDLAGLRNAGKVILLLPAGTSAHIEAGIAFGLGKPLILIGEPEKAESLYFIFQERYKTQEEFLSSLD